MAQRRVYRLRGLRLCEVGMLTLSYARLDLCQLDIFGPYKIILKCCALEFIYIILLQYLRFVMLLYHLIKMFLYELFILI